jgi:hypothetical protein
MHTVALARCSPKTPPAAIDAAAVLCLLAGNSVGDFVFPPTWRVLGVYPTFVVGVALVAIRCALWPRPSVIETLRARLTGGDLPRRVMWTAALTRAAVLAVGLAASLAHADRVAENPRISNSPLVSLPARWDAFWYHGIARYGYAWQPGHDDAQQNIAFFPAFPIAMHVAGDLLTIPAYALRAPNLFGSGDGRVMWGGVFLSIVCFLLAIPRVFRVALLDTGDEAAAGRACLLLAAYPYALFFSAPYSESLALLALASLVLAWRRQERRGAIWGVVFGLCRSNGWCVAVALLADRLLARRRSDWRTTCALIAAAPVGAIAYSAYVYRLTGHPFAWAAAQHAWGATLDPTSFVRRRWEILHHLGAFGYLGRDPADVIAFVAVTLMIGVSVAALMRREWLNGAIVLAYLAPAIAIDLPAVGRLSALMFPAFIFLSRKIHGATFAATFVLFLAGQMWFAYRFFLWRTPY